MSIRTKLIGIGTTLAFVFVFLILAQNNDIVQAKSWGGNHIAGGQAITIVIGDTKFQFPTGFTPDDLADPGALISFRSQGRVDRLIDRNPDNPDGRLRSAEGATILGRATWVDQSSDPPRIITLNDPIGYACNAIPGFKASGFGGLGTDSLFGPVQINFRAFDRDPDKVFIFTRELGGRGTPIIYAALAEVTNGQVRQLACQK